MPTLQFSGFICAHPAAPAALGAPPCAVGGPPGRDGEVLEEGWRARAGDGCTASRSVSSFEESQPEPPSPGLCWRGDPIVWKGFGSFSPCLEYLWPFIYQYWCVWGCAFIPRSAARVISASDSAGIVILPGQQSSNRVMSAIIHPL